MNIWRKSSWQTKAAAKREATFAKIPKDWLLPTDVLETAKRRRSIVGDFIEDLLDEDTRAITRRTSEDNLALMRQGSLTAVEHVEAFCKRAAFAHQLNSNLLEIRFDLALERAKEPDHYFQEHRRLIGPLHGLPYTTKDQFHMKGVDTTMSYIGWIGTQAGRVPTKAGKNLESELISELNALGAIPIAKVYRTILLSVVIANGVVDNVDSKPMGKIP